MRYTKEKAALQAYIDRFNPEEFSSTGQSLAAVSPTPEQLIRVQKLKIKLKRRRQVFESLQSLLAKEMDQPEVMITQDEVDALLEEWGAKN
ncbi:MAG: hypothetical protein PHI06_04890 [Desulfobulbaceae bacterium]|nr:hypothetical protein [Desulfobulbaceae bacterium]